MKITFLQTGGTIDKDYPRTTKGYAFEIAEPAVNRILKKLNPSFEYDVLSVLKKDSLDISDADRQVMLEACIDLECDKLIITHGTDTMIETARVLSQIKGKTLVITGAMRPERFANSDAAINLGIAIGVVVTLPPGVYIAMHGQVIPWDQCERDMVSGKYAPK